METLTLELTPLEFDALGAFLQRTAPGPAEMLAHRVLLGKLEEALQRHRAAQQQAAPDEKPRRK
jgi:hypothetical protein